MTPEQQQTMIILKCMDGTYRSGIKPPIGYPGNKMRSLKEILPMLPLRHKYCEPFGGMGCVMLNRPPSEVEVFNDRYGAITDFFKVIQDDGKCHALITKLELTVHSREFWDWCKETWTQELDMVERAFKWYYSVRHSFGQMGRHFGRSVGDKNGDSQKLLKSIPGLLLIHDRLKNVLIENQDGINLAMDVDSHDCVHYFDPPYADCGQGAYAIPMMQEQEHEELLDAIFHLDGYVALSGYSNPLYDKYKWDKKFEWPVTQNIKSMAFTKGNHKEHLTDRTRGKVNEVLWIKEERK